MRPQYIHVFIASFTLSLLLRTDFSSFPSTVDVFVSFAIAAFITSIVEVAIYFTADFVYDALVVAGKELEQNKDMEKAFFAKASPVLLEDNALYINGNMVRMSDDEMILFNRLVQSHTRGRPLETGTEEFRAKMVRVGFMTEAGTLSHDALQFIDDH